MRHDMYKVIVERPRRGGGFSRTRQAPDDLEDSPRQEGLRKRHSNRKWLNENLRPLERFLGSQINRPWNKVYAEICAGIDRRNTVQQHIHQHIGDFVALDVIEIDGVLHANRGWRTLAPLASRWAAKFYVDPKAGLLRINRFREQACRDSRAERRAAQHILPEHRRVIGPMCQLHRIDGLWYQIDLASMPGIDACDTALDVLRHIPAIQCPTSVDRKNICSNQTLFGHDHVYARNKRQLNVRELRHYRLDNSNA